MEDGKDIDLGFVRVLFSILYPPFSVLSEGCRNGFRQFLPELRVFDAFGLVRI
jgi:hypothetical protein